MAVRLSALTPGRFLVLVPVKRLSRSHDYSAAGRIMEQFSPPVLTNHMVVSWWLASGSLFHPIMALPLTCCLMQELAESPPKVIIPEDGNFKVWWNIKKFSTFFVTRSWKLKLSIWPHRVTNVQTSGGNTNTQLNSRKTQWAGRWSPGLSTMEETGEERHDIYQES
jgi:hypothetical protein